MSHLSGLKYKLKTTLTQMFFFQTNHFFYNKSPQLTTFLNAKYEKILGKILHFLVETIS